MSIRQLYEHESSTYSYLIFDKDSKECALIDSVIETFDRDTQLINELGLNLKYLIETHIHADHATSAKKMKHFYEKSPLILGSKAGGQIGLDQQLEHNDEIIISKNIKLKALSTPGHTNSCMSYYMENDKGSYVFTGDTLLIRGCGRTDFQEGSNETLFRSVRETLFNLPERTIVYPGHDYQGRTCSSIWEEKSFNPRLNLNNDLQNFSQIMDNLNLDYPKKIDQVLPLNKDLS